MFNAYEFAQTLIHLRDDELIDVFDELAVNWPHTYREIIATIKDNAEWHIGDGDLNKSTNINTQHLKKAA